MARLLDDLLFDAGDPFGRSQFRLGKNLLSQPSPTEPYDPQTQEGLLDNMLGKSMGFLQYLGETLDKPGRAVRGLLAGKPGELANLIPFSDTIGLTDPQQSVGGRDLLEQYGVLDKNTPGLDWGDAAGFAADVLLDPTTYVGLGGLTAAGKAAQASNKLTKGLGAGIRAGEKGLFDVGLPLGNLASKHLGMTSLESVPVGTGKAAADFAENVGKIPGAVGDFAADWIPGGKFARDTAIKAKAHIAANFDKDVGETLQPLSQELHRKYASDDAIRELAYPHVKSLHEKRLAEVTAKNLENKDWVRALRDGADGIVQPGEYAAKGMPALEPAVAHGAALKPRMDDMLFESQRIGLPVEQLDDLKDGTMNYAARYHHPDEWPGLLQNIVRSIKSRKMAFKGRLPFLHSIPSGTEGINDFFADAALWDLPTSKLAAEKLVLDHGIADMDQARKIASWVRAQDKADYFTKTVDPATGAITETFNGRKMFNADVFTDAIVREGVHARKIGSGNFIQALVKDTAIHMTPSQAADAVAAGTHIRVKDMFDQLGMKSFKQKIPGVPDPLRWGAMPYAAAQMGVATGGKPFKALKNTVVPIEYFNDMMTVAKKWDAPETLSWVVDSYDKLLQAFKAGSTQMWPAFHGRNAGSGLYYNAISGAADMSGGALKDAIALRMGHDVDATRYGYASQNDLLADAMASEVWKPSANRTIDVAPHGPVSQNVMGQMGLNIPSVPTNPFKAGKDKVKAIGEAWSQGTSKGDSLLKSIDAFMNAGRQTGNAVEDILRMNQFLGRKVQGWTTEAASNDVRKWLFDYGALAPFEKSVAKRAVPFWTWMRKNVPLVLDELMHKPGGALGQSIRAANFARQDQGYLPEHIGEGLAIPVPGNPDRFITGVGLPFENLLPLKFAPSLDQTIRRSGESLLSQMTPAITAPYSMISGREPFFGRENKDLYPYPFPKGFPGGQTLNILANKVIGRPVTELRKGFDERKGIGVKAANLFTGVKITDLSGGIERQKALEASRILKDELDEAPGVKSTEHFYLDPANKGKPADSEALKLLKLKRGLEKQGKAQAKKNQSPYEQILLGNL